MEKSSRGCRGIVNTERQRHLHTGVMANCTLDIHPSAVCGRDFGDDGASRRRECSFAGTCASWCCATRGIEEEFNMRCLTDWPRTRRPKITHSSTCSQEPRWKSFRSFDCASREEKRRYAKQVSCTGKRVSCKCLSIQKRKNLLPHGLTPVMTAETI